MLRPERNLDLVTSTANLRNGLVFFEHALELWNRESIDSVLFKSSMLGWWWINIVKDTLVDGEVHEGDSELFLNLGLFLNVLLHNHGHLFNRIHFRFLGYINPVLELLVKVDSSLSSLLELIECPVPDLHKSVPQNSFLNANAFSHFFDIQALFDLLFLFLSSSTLLGIFTLSSFTFAIS